MLKNLLLESTFLDIIECSHKFAKPQNANVKNSSQLLTPSFY